MKTSKDTPISQQMSDLIDEAIDAVEHHGRLVKDLTDKISAALGITKTSKEETPRPDTGVILKMTKNTTWRRPL